MKQNDFEVVSRLLKAVRFQGSLKKIDWSVEDDFWKKGKTAVFVERKNFYNDRLTLEWKMRGNEDGVPMLLGAAGELKKPIEIPQVMINGINVPELDKKLSEISWYDPRTYDRILNTGSKEFQAVVDMSELYLFKTPDAYKAYEALAYKHFNNSPAEKIMPEMEAIKSRNDLKLSLDFKMNPLFTGDEIYNLLSGRFVAKDPGGKEGEVWYNLDFKNKNKDNNSHLNTMEKLPVFDFGEALQKATIAGATELNRNEDILTRLKAGDAVVFPLHNNNLEGYRALYMDPIAGKLLIDRYASTAAGLYDLPVVDKVQREKGTEEETQEKLEKYKPKRS